MKNKTKLIALLLTVAMLFTLSACAPKKLLEDKLQEALTDPSLEDALAELETALDDLEDTLEDSAEDMDDAAEDLEDAIEDAIEDAPVEETVGDFRRGSFSGNTYASEFIGIGLDLPEGWTFYDDEQIANISGMTQDVLDDNGVNSALESGRVIFDMYAVDNAATSLNICVENLGAVYGSVLDEEEYFDISEANLVSAFESMDATDVISERDTIFFAGKDCPALFVSCDMGGVELYEAIIAIKCDNYMAVITAAGIDPDAVIGIVDSFYAL